MVHVPAPQLVEEVAAQLADDLTEPVQVGGQLDVERRRGGEGLASDYG